MFRSLALLGLITLGRAVIGPSPDESSIPQCPQNMEYRVIGDLCEQTCGVIEPSCQVQEIVLWPFELSKCQCKLGFYRLVLTGPCVPLNQCNSIKGDRATSKRIPRAALPSKERIVSQLPKRQMKRTKKMKKQSGMNPDEAKSMILERAILKPFASLVYGPVMMFGR